jgi:hypothetical protein
MSEPAGGASPDLRTGQYSRDAADAPTRLF